MIRVASYTRKNHQPISGFLPLEEAQRLAGEVQTTTGKSVYLLTAKGGCSQGGFQVLVRRDP